jgi:hypothetical protein
MTDTDAVLSRSFRTVAVGALRIAEKVTHEMAWSGVTNAGSLVYGKCGGMPGAGFRRRAPLVATVKGVLILLLSGVGVVAALAAWGQQPGPAEREIPVSWSPKLHLASLKDIDAALRGPFYDEPFRARPAGKAGAWVTVRNCQDYLDVAAYGDFELDPEIGVIGERAIQAEGLRCFALQLLKNARPPHKTFLADFHFTGDVGNLLPPDLGMVVSPDEEEEVRAADKRGIS